MQINWSKSQFLPLDVDAPTADQAALPLVRTSRIRYLGAQISRTLTEYIDLNIEPLYNLLKTKTQTWFRHPLGIMGRINLVKMILLPKPLYLFWHAPLYIPTRSFKSMESILNMFVWGPSRHKLSWRVLKCPVHLGGTALPDLAQYYVASQLFHFFYFNQADRDRYSTLVCSSASSPVAHPFQILLWGTQESPHRGNRAHMMFHHCKIWQMTMSITKAPTFHTPLWDNPQLPEMLTIPDYKLWITRG